MLTGERPLNPVNNVRLASGAMSLDPAAEERIMLKVFNDFQRRPELLARFDEVARCYSRLLRLRRRACTAPA